MRHKCGYHGYLKEPLIAMHCSGFACFDFTLLTKKKKNLSSIIILTQNGPFPPIFKTVYVFLVLWVYLSEVMSINLVLM